MPVKVLQHLEVKKALLARQEESCEKIDENKYITIMSYYNHKREKIYNDYAKFWRLIALLKLQASYKNPVNGLQNKYILLHNHHLLKISLSVIHLHDRAISRESLRY